jgi:hypothetical protein
MTGHNKACMLNAGLPFEAVCTCEVENARTLSIDDGIALYQKRTGKPWPVAATNAAADEAGDALVSGCVKALALNVPELPPAARRPTAEEFIGFFGKLVSALEAVAPSPAKAAALLALVKSLNIDASGEVELKTILTLVECVAPSKVPAANAKPD